MAPNKEPASIHSLPVELFDQIIAPFTGHLKKLECTKCRARQCTCYDPWNTDTWSHIIGRNVTVLAALNRTCKFFQAITTRPLYRCPMPWSHQGSWYLARTLTPIPGVSGHPSPTTHRRSPATIWENGGILPEEVVAYYDILRPTTPKNYNSTATLKRHNSVPVDLLVSLCPNVETLEMNNDVGPPEPISPRGIGLRTWGPHQISFKKLKTIKIWRGDEPDPRNLFFILVRLQHLSPNVNNLSTTILDPFDTRMAWTFDNLSALLGRLERLQLFAVDQEDNRTPSLLRQSTALKSLAIKYSPACAEVNPLVATRSILSWLPRTVKELELDAREVPRNRKIVQYKHLEYKHLADMLGSALGEATRLLERRGIRLVWRE